MYPLIEYFAATNHFFRVSQPRASLSQLSRLCARVQTTLRALTTLRAAALAVPQASHYPRVTRASCDNRGRAAAATSAPAPPGADAHRVAPRPMRTALSPRGRHANSATQLASALSAAQVVVVDPGSGLVPFFSRFAGSGVFCFL